MSFKIENFTTTDLETTNYIKPVSISYKQNGKEKNWEAVESFDSVAVLLYHEEKNSFLLVKQFRPPVYMSDKSYGHTYELCAGIIDKDLSLEQIVKEEIDEECGYDVDVKDIEKITSFFTNVGVSGGKQHLYFAIINESMKIHNGGGINDEEIILEFLPLEDGKKFIYDETKGKTPGLMFAFYWFFERIKGE
ncbi:MAG: NUDIX hydrolase [Campylobacterales bacterium]|nr:NUDIX hydrolase [Campylobacterales bacterium]